DALLRGQARPAQTRWIEAGEMKTADAPARLVQPNERRGGGLLEIVDRGRAPADLEPVPIGRGVVKRKVDGPALRIYPFGVSLNRLEQAIEELRVPAEVTKNPREANAVVTLKNYYRRRPPAIREAEAAGVPVYVLKSNTVLQMEQLLANVY